MTTTTPLAESYWPAPSDEPVINKTFGAALREAAQAVGDRTALIQYGPNGRSWTFAQLLDEAERCAQWLLERVSPGDRVCMWAPNVPEWVVLDYGAGLAGVVVATANPRLRIEELAYIVEQSRSSLLISADEHRGTDLIASAREAAAGRCDVFPLSRWEQDVRGWDGTPRPLPDVQPTDPVQIQYTSGTTGRPKGALLHHRGLLSNAMLLAERAGFSDGVIVSGLPLFHTSGTSINALMPVATRSTAVIPDAFDPDTILNAVEEHRGALIGAVPTMLLALLEEPSLSERNLDALQVVITGGAPVPPELLRRVEQALGCDLLTLYGQTELSPAISMTGPDDSVEQKSATAGRPLPGVEVKICGRDGALSPVGEEGEICARGTQMMLGYFDMPERTAETVDPEGWLHTGDLGTMDEHGYIRITGRLTDMIIRGGENTYPAEIEAVYFEHPDVAENAVFGLPDPRWGEIVAAAIRLERGASIDIAQLDAFGRNRLAGPKVPTRWFVVDAFPQTGSGKIQKFRLRELAEAGELKPLY